MIRVRFKARVFFHFKYKHINKHTFHSHSFQHLCLVNKEYLSQIQFYSIFSELPVLRITVVIITVYVKVANSAFLVTNKRTKWSELSRYYLWMLFCKVIFDY